MKSLFFIALLATSTSSAWSAEATVSDKFAQVRGFSVERISTDPAGGSVILDQQAWNDVTFAVMAMPAAEKTNSPGHKTVGELTLRKSSKELLEKTLQWVADCSQKSARCSSAVRFRAIDPNAKQMVVADYTIKNCFVSGVNLDLSQEGLDSDGITVRLQCDLNGQSREYVHEAAHTVQQIARARHDALKSVLNVIR